MSRDLIGGLGFAGFVVGVLFVSWARTAWPEYRRRAVTGLLIAYCVGLSFLAGVTRKDLWPFSSWNLMAAAPPAEIGDVGSIRLRLVGVSANGTEYPVDYRAFDPLTHVEFGTWLGMHAPTLDPPEQAQVGQRLLDQINQARARVRDGRSPGHVRRWGPLSAPSHFVHMARWHDPADVPAEPFVAFRVYREYFNVAERIRDRDDLELRLVFEHRAQP